MNIAKSNIDTKTATFAGGCFWCVEAAFEYAPGVVEAVEQQDLNRLAAGTILHFKFSRNAARCEWKNWGQISFEFCGISIECCLTYDYFGRGRNLQRAGQESANFIALSA